MLFDDYFFRVQFWILFLYNIKGKNLGFHQKLNGTLPTDP